LEFGGGDDEEYADNSVFKIEFDSGVVAVGDVLYMSLSSGNHSYDEPNIYFDIVLTDNRGNTAMAHINDFGGVANPVTVNIFSPIFSLVSDTREPVLQMINIPTNAFAGIEGEIVSMEWVFVAGDTRQVLYVDDLMVSRLSA